MSTCTKRNKGWLFSNTFHEICMNITEPSSSFLTPKENEVVDDFIKIAVNHPYGGSVYMSQERMKAAQKHGRDVTKLCS